jgi:hypothetical protein
VKIIIPKDLLGRDWQDRDSANPVVSLLKRAWDEHYRHVLITRRRGGTVHLEYLHDWRELRAKRDAAAE